MENGEVVMFTNFDDEKYNLNASTNTGKLSVNGRDERAASRTETSSSSSLLRRNDLASSFLEDTQAQSDDHISWKMNGDNKLDENMSNSESDSDDYNLDQFIVLRDSDYDTDLEMDDNKWVYPERYDHDFTGYRRYIEACKDFSVQPIKYFLDHMREDKMTLKYQGLGPEAMRALAAPLEVNTTIESMDLEGNWLMEEGTLYLCRVLKENVFITHLNLSDNRLGFEGAAAVCKLLMVNKTIEMINLTGNNIGDQAGELFHAVLTKSNSNLRFLNLSHNRLEDVSAQWFKVALIENEALEVLDLSWNHFQKKGCSLIAEGLKENVGLKELSVAMDGFGSEGGKALGEALKVNRTLLKLDASFCRLPSDSAMNISQGLVHNDSLKELNLSYNCLRPEETMHLLKGIEKNESSHLSLLNLGVEAKFKDLQDKLQRERNLVVIHGGIIDNYRMEIREMDQLEMFKRDPFTKLKEWVAQAGYRLIDLLRHFDKDQSMTISEEEFRRGIASTNIPISEQQLQILLARLDKDGNGEIDFSELLEGDRKHRKAKRDVLVEMERRKSQGK